MSNQRLPRDTNWILFHDLAPETTQEDLQALIAGRTGVEIPVENIFVEYRERFNCCSGIVAMTREHIAALLTWALCEDTLHGRTLNIIAPKRRERQPA